MKRDPTGPGLIKTTGRLPHWEIAGGAYFVTWRCAAGSVLQPEDRDIVAESLRHWEGRRYLLFAAVIMPDHVHVVLKPLPESSPTSIGGPRVSLSRILHTAKSYTAKRINQRRGSSGAVWQRERFDRIVRDYNEFIEKLNYVRNNPVLRGLARTPEDYAWLLDQEVQ